MRNMDSFLHSIGMHPAQTDIFSTTEDFLEEINLGLAGKPSSLRMIPTYISAEGVAPNDIPVVAIDAGGTNLRVALVTFRCGKAAVEQLKRYPMPGSIEEIDVDEFFNQISDMILPLCRESSHISFCFSYPAEIFPNRDGKMLQLNKEVRVRGTAGVIIGETLLAKLRDKGLEKQMKFTLLNDAAAGLMGGAATLELSYCDGLSGLILGTGNNTCYMEKGEKILKLPNARDMIINCESGVFDKAFRGVSDRLTDEVSEIPGDHLLEKMISGVYHGRVITNTVRLAAKEGLMSSPFNGDYAPFTTPELDDFLRGVDNRISRMCSSEDEEKLCLIIDRSFERAAKLVCANIAALCIHCDGGGSAEHPFCVLAEGSTFYNSLLFRDKLDKHIESHIVQKLSHHVVCLRAENSTLAGAALAALIN